MFGYKIPTQQLFLESREPLMYLAGNRSVVKSEGRQEVCIVVYIIDGPSDTDINATQAGAT